MVARGTLILATALALGVLLLVLVAAPAADAPARAAPAGGAVAGLFAARRGAAGACTPPNPPLSIEWTGRPSMAVSFSDKLSVDVYMHHFPGSMHQVDFWSAVEQGAWKRSTLLALEYFLAKSSRSVFIDVGAWIGPTTLFAAQFAGAVYAIEPDPTSFSTLNANVRLNPAAAAKTRLFFECIAAEAAAAAEFVGSGDGSSRSAAAVGDAGLRGGSGWTVPCRTLPDFIAAEGVDVEQLALVKLDVVGMELSVLASLKGFLAARRTKPAILLTVYAPAWKRDDGSDHALRLAAAWEIASSYKFLYDERLEPLGKDARTFCATAGCRMLLSDTAYLGPSGDA